MAQLERDLGDGHAIEPHERDLLFLLDSYAERADPAWQDVLARAVEAAPTATSGEPRKRPTLRLVHAA